MLIKEDRGVVRRCLGCGGEVCGGTVSGRSAEPPQGLVVWWCVAVDIGWLSRFHGVRYVKK